MRFIEEAPLRKGVLLYLNDLERFLHDLNSKGIDSIAKDIEDELDICLRLFILL